MLGSQLVADAPEGFTAVGTDLASGVAAPGVDLAEPALVAQLFEDDGPFSGVIHAAAYTAVDEAEEEEELAFRVNVRASEVLADACARAQVPLVLVSTDFVFDGSKREPYGVDEPTAPLGVYGRTKLAGEHAARSAWGDGLRIVRTQWLYGPRGNSFPRTMVRLARETDHLRVVDDQVGAPTSTLELAPALWDVLTIGEPGVYHAACEGSASWYELAVRSIELAGLADRVTVEPCTTEEFPRPAPRPAYSVLDCRRLTALRGRTLRHWSDALVTFFELADPAGSD